MVTLVLALAAATLAAPAQDAKRADSQKGGAGQGARKPLTIKEADVWRTFRGVALSRDGKWFAYRAGPLQGDAIPRRRCLNGIYLRDKDYAGRVREFFDHYLMDKP